VKKGRRGKGRGKERKARLQTQLQTGCSALRPRTRIRGPGGRAFLVHYAEAGRIPASPRALDNFFPRRVGHDPIRANGEKSRPPIAEKHPLVYVVCRIRNPHSTRCCTSFRAGNALHRLHGEAESCVLRWDASSLPRDAVRAGGRAAGKIHRGIEPTMTGATTINKEFFYRARSWRWGVVGGRTRWCFDAAGIGRGGGGFSRPERERGRAGTNGLHFTQGRRSRPPRRPGSTSGQNSSNFDEDRRSISLVIGV